MTDESKPEPPRTAVPIIAALAVVLAIVAAVIIAGIISPAEDNLTEGQQIEVSVTEFIAARNGDDEQRKRDTACAQFDGKILADRKGKLSYEKVADVALDGNSAKAEVTTKVDDKDEKTATWNFVRRNGKWLVCN
ncbi:hypothetical protein [Antrihabitans stalactiti]|uniref:DUF4878 domain-containing protein n=1 Tax=Antrihabitans stalactiti TaxID=2584121 RepID=A0A848KNA1_9NOCA|nr:hypothetical protein [Antrihabitans stalactiti]NMN98132.1 hypothetical protein [Antrihabitans stalactiti]